MITRRLFFSALSGLPFVGAWFSDMQFTTKVYGLQDDDKGRQWEVTNPEHMIEIQERRIKDLEAEVSDLHATLEVIEKNHIEWISVEERLPEHCLNVLIHLVNRDTGSGVISIGSDRGYWRDGLMFGVISESSVIYDVTHWAELPALPQLIRVPEIPMRSVSSLTVDYSESSQEPS